MIALLLLLLAPDVDPPSKLFDPGRCGLVRTVAPLGGDLLALSFSNDGARLAVGCGNTVRIYETRTWTQVKKLAGHAEPVMGVAIRGDGKCRVRAYLQPKDSRRTLPVQWIEPAEIEVALGSGRCVFDVKVPHRTIARKN